MCAINATLLLYATATLALPVAECNQLADAIWRVEGGSRTSYPYGIKCHKHSPDDARRLCIATVQANYERWLKAGRPGEFITFLGNRYCPPSVDKVGNERWIRNLRIILKESNNEIQNRH